MASSRNARIRAGVGAGALGAAVACAASVAGPFDAPGRDRTPPMEELVQARLALESAGIAPGQKTHLAVTFDIAPAWHLYWMNPGDTGVAPRIRLELPAGVRAGEAMWPAPSRHAHQGILDYVHEGRLTIVYPIEVDAEAVFSEGTARFGAKLDWLVCREECLMGDGEVAMVAPAMGAAEAARPSADASLFAAARRRIPTAPGPGDGVATSWEGSTLEIRVTEAESLTWFPHPPADRTKLGAEPADMMEDGHAAGSRLRIRHREGVLGAPHVRGVLERRGKDGEARYFLIDIAGPKAG